jgi:hypothetical protein
MRPNVITVWEGRELEWRVSFADGLYVTELLTPVDLDGEFDREALRALCVYDDEEEP